MENTENNTEKNGLFFKLDKFEGPLDLLLHLIDRNKIDIYDIPIAEITDQYMAYVDYSKGKVDMDTMSEFLVMAATLLDIKCRMLLPRTKDEKGEEIDPRDELVHKLLEYKMYRYMSGRLRQKESLAAQNVYREKKLPAAVASYVPPVDYKELIGDTTLSGLTRIFQSVIRRQKFRVDPVRSGFGRIERPSVDLDEKELYIKAFLNRNHHVDFEQLLESNPSKDEVIVTFLVVLELIRTGNIHVRQDQLFGKITIETLHYIDTSSTTADDFST